MIKTDLLRGGKGVSYIQILLASSVIAGLAVVGLKMMENQERLARITSQRFETTYIINEMTHLLKDPRNCKASFSGINPKKSVRKINALKKELRGGKHKDTSFYLKYFTFDSSKKLYGQNNIKIISYELSDQGKEVDTEKGSTNLIVSFKGVDNDKDNASLKRSISLKFRLDGASIGQCEAFNNSLRKGDVSVGGSVTLGKGLHVGSQKEGAQVSLKSGLTLVPIGGEFPECNISNVGTLIYMKKFDGERRRSRGHHYLLIRQYCMNNYSIILYVLLA